MQNQRVVIAARPTGMVRESDFQLESLPVETMGPGDVLVEVTYLSLDPYMRGMMRERTPYGDRRPIPIGGLMIGEGVGRVARSNTPLSVGDIVAGPFGWQSVAVSKADKCRKVDLSLGPVTTALGVLGMPGLTAYFGLIEICHPRSGETVFISGAAGAVGSCAGQIAKALGCRVVGSAGSDEKVAKLTSDYRFDAAFNYKATTAYEIKLKELCPNGIDCYFDNVGGAITDAVFHRINTGARISICGQISIYNDEPDTAPRWLSQLLVKQAKAEGFLVTKFYPRTAEAIAQLAGWIRAGKVKYEETIVEGLENAPKAFVGIFQGENRGKLLVKIRA
jgi:NADPH-dependent curcumin reductase CurA